MKRYFAIIIVAVLMMACGNGNGNTAVAQSKKQSKAVTEVIYFHGKQRCLTCNAIEKLAKEVVDSIGAKKVAMKVVDISKKENEALADKYEVTWSSLFVVKNGKAVNLTDMAFGNARRNPAVFKQKLTAEIDKKK